MLQTLLVIKLSLVFMYTQRYRDRYFSVLLMEQAEVSQLVLQNRLIKRRAVWMPEIVLILRDSQLLCIVSTYILVCCKNTMYLRGKVLAESCFAEACWQVRGWHNQVTDVIIHLRVRCSHMNPSFKNYSKCCLWIYWTANECLGTLIIPRHWNKCFYI